jgi:hypothetical protein
MKYLKYFESSHYLNAVDYFEDIVDLMKHKGYAIDKLKIVDDEIYAGEKKITVDYIGNVYYHMNDTVSKGIGRVSLKPSINADGEMKNFNNTEFEYSDGSKIKVGDPVIVDGKYLGVVDGFSNGNVIIEDQDEFTTYVKPTQLKLQGRETPPEKPDWM